jgi:hypothetical protein
MSSLDFVESHTLVPGRDAFGELLIKLLVIAAITLGLFCAFCAGATWARMQQAGIYMQKANDLLEMSAENEKQTRDALKGMHLQQGSRDAGQVSEL